MPYMKLYCTPTPTGSQTAIRVVAGADRDHASLAGTLVLPSDILEQFLDAAVHGAAALRSSSDPLTIHYGPEETDPEV